MSDADRDPTVTDREILAVIERADREQLRTEEVADELPLATDRLVDRLDELHERDLVALADDDLPGDRWSLAPDGRQEIEASGEDVETAVEAQATKVTGAESLPRDEETPESPPPDPQADPEGFDEASPLDRIEPFDPPGTAEEKERRLDALRRAYAYLRERDGVDRGEFESEVFPDARGGYEHPDDWWDQVVRPGLERFPGVVPPDEGDEEWRFDEDEAEGAPER